MLNIERTRVVVGGVVYTRKTIRNSDGRGSERVVYVLKAQPIVACKSCQRLARFAA